LSGPPSIEQQLAADAEARGWAREVERHQRTAERIHGVVDVDTVDSFGNCEVDRSGDTRQPVGERARNELVVQG
jgi:hypothetical protein